jgi:hypothetical protein
VVVSERLFHLDEDAPEVAPMTNTFLCWKGILQKDIHLMRPIVVDLILRWSKGDLYSCSSLSDHQNHDIC